MKKSYAKEILFGTAVGDSLGVPVEFVSREVLQSRPLTGMQGYGTHHQPPGTWSDDSSLSFCLAESLCGGYRLNDIANRFVKWFYEGYWTSHGEVFDYGTTTRIALQRLKRGENPQLAGESKENDNGNGSLMRILPLMPFIASLSFDERVTRITEVSSLTHRHPRSILGCLLLVEYALVLREQSPRQALLTLAERIPGALDDYPHLKQELTVYNRLFYRSDHANNPLSSQEESSSESFLEEVRQLEPEILSADILNINSKGYVVYTLEASLWCLLQGKTFADTVLKAVNLGDDSDTTGAVTGALAAICYGYDAIPQEWIRQLARKEDIAALAETMDRCLG